MNNLEMSSVSRISHEERLLPKCFSMGPSRIKLFFFFFFGGGRGLCIGLELGVGMLGLV